MQEGEHACWRRVRARGVQAFDYKFLCSSIQSKRAKWQSFTRWNLDMRVIHCPNMHATAYPTIESHRYLMNRMDDHFSSDLVACNLSLNTRGKTLFYGKMLRDFWLEGDLEYFFKQVFLCYAFRATIKFCVMSYQPCAYIALASWMLINFLQLVQLCGNQKEKEKKT